MKVVFLFFVLICYPSQESNIEIESNQKYDLWDEVYLSSGEKLSSKVDELSLIGPFTLHLSIETKSTVDFDGYISLQSKYMKADNWRIINGSDTLRFTGKRFAVPIKLIAKSPITVIFDLPELDRANPKRLDLFYLPTNSHLLSKEQDVISQVFFLSIYAFLCLFNFIMFLVTKWKIYYKYGLYILSSIIYFLYYFDFLQQVFPSIDSISINITYSLYSIIFILYFIFINDLGNYKNSIPKASFYLKVGIYYKIIQMLLEIILHVIGVNFTNLFFYKYGFLLFEISLMCLIIFYIIKARDFRGKIVIFGSSILIVSGILVQLDVSFDRAYILELGILGELLLFSVALGYITKEFFEEKNQNQKLYIEQLERNERIQTELERKLEQKVNDRTEQLNLEKDKAEKKSQENTILLNEIHHRVKNNLQMITSLFEMQERRLKTTSAKSVLSLAKNRVKSIGLVHEHLYQQNDLTRIRLKEYVPRLLKMVINSLNKEDNTSIFTKIETIDVGAESGIHIGLILNELITNSIKYAFVDHERLEIRITIHETDSQLQITYQDNGPGMDDAISSEGLGHTIINTLSESMFGKMDILTSKKGVNIQITLSEY